MKRLRQNCAFFSCLMFIHLFLVPFPYLCLKANLSLKRNESKNILYLNDISNQQSDTNISLLSEEFDELREVRVIDRTPANVGFISLASIQNNDSCTLNKICRKIIPSTSMGFLQINSRKTLLIKNKPIPKFSICSERGHIQKICMKKKDAQRYKLIKICKNKKTGKVKICYKEITSDTNKAITIPKLKPEVQICQNKNTGKLKICLNKQAALIYPNIKVCKNKLNSKYKFCLIKKQSDKIRLCLPNKGGEYYNLCIPQKEAQKFQGKKICALLIDKIGQVCAVRFC